MPQKTRDGDSDRGRSLERHNGSDALIKFKVNDPVHSDNDMEFHEIPVTSVDWSADYSMNEVQHNGSLEATLAPTEIRYSGSFEYSGQNPELMSYLVRGKPDFEGGTDPADHIDATRPTRFNLTLKEYNHENNGNDGTGGSADTQVVETTYQFKRCAVTSVSRDLSSGDSSSATFDWQAETMQPYTGAPSGSGGGETDQ